MRRLLLALLSLALLGGCVQEAPRYGEVFTMTADEAARISGSPAPGTVWRLDEGDLKKLSPAPILPAPPPPRYPPPPAYYPPPPPPGWYGPPY